MATRTPTAACIGVVIIGRNEGERLIRCLESVAGLGPTVYVDSGSTDGSVAAARTRGAEVVELDLARPFTAARARNAGLRRLVAVAPSAEFVQFVDGDCEVVAGWPERAAAELSARPDAAVVCGRRRERRPDGSVYNRLADMEWDTPVSESAEACGGDALMRIADVLAVGGYDESLIAGEEPELCLRLRGRGRRIVRIDADMTLHDAAMTRFAQWWRRNRRAGHAFAEVSALHAGGSLPMWRRETDSNWFWGLLLPGGCLAAGLLLGPVALLPALAGYALLGWRVWRRRRRAFGDPPGRAAVYAGFTVLGKFPQAAGQLRYRLGRLTARRARLMEYK